MSDPKPKAATKPNEAAEAPAVSKEPTHFRVVLRQSAQPGIKFCGTYQADKTYEVKLAEAERLHTAKGFSFPTVGDRDAYNTAIAARNQKSEG